MATIRDVAREAAVGVGTVSRVLSGSPQVAPETRARVQATIERLGYRPSPLGRALARGRSQTLEVIVPLFTRYFYVEVLRGIEVALADTDYALVIRTIERPADRDRAFADPGSRGRAEGVLIVSLTPTAELLARLAATALPAVLVNNVHPALPSVALDHEAAAALAVQHLVRLGHRRIALVDHLEDPFAPSSPSGRRCGYRATLARAGLELRPEYERVTDFSPEAGMAALDALLALPQPPTAVFAGSDTQAVGVLEAARRRGVAVPDDLALVGYNDIEMAGYLGLTTIRVPMRELGRLGVQQLLLAFETPERAAGQIRLEPELIVRHTCGAVQAAAR
ncbi:MAG: LacI family DNA-binding transcriptional regulator [Chloroflexi bacterium]|nr:LacI family DNA-binding transcriptional regulator [Chloroflexota bacterium]